MTLCGRSASPPRWIALKALQGEARGRFVPSRLIVPCWRYGSGQMPDGSTRHPSQWADTAIYLPARVPLREYTYKIFARICNAWRDTPPGAGVQPWRAKGCRHRCQSPPWISPNFGQADSKSWNRSQYQSHRQNNSKLRTVLCKLLLFAGACRCAFQQQSAEDSSAAAS